MAIFRKKGRQRKLPINPPPTPPIAEDSSSDDDDIDDDEPASGTSSDSSSSEGEESSSDESPKEGSNSSSKISSTSYDVMESDQESICEAIPTFEDRDSGKEPPEKRRASRTKKISKEQYGERK